MNDSRIKEIYSLKSDISWMNDEARHSISQAEMHVYKPERAATYQSWLGPMKIRHAKACGCVRRR